MPSRSVHTRVAAPVTTVWLVVSACTSSSAPPTSGTECALAGGVCVLGGTACAAEPPTSAQDCNPNRNPGGSFCCLALADAGVDAADASAEDSAPADAAEAGIDAGHD